MKDESTVLFLKRPEPGSNGAVPGADETIVDAVVQAARETEAALARRGDGADVSFESMLGLVSYCYARGVYASGEIERKLRKGWHDIPGANAIRRFRRDNRAALQATLEKTLRVIRRARCPAGVTPRPCEETVFIRREAAEKIETAALVDMALNE